jgi:glycosyltransferase involved in cell wall biosynthesis
MQNPEKVSVVLSCYNGANTLEKCLQSINMQSINLELVFVNDGSSDNTLNIFKNFKFNENIKLKLISRENKGFMYSLDQAIKNSTGEYIARIDADDIWQHNHISLIMNEFNKDNNLVLVGSSAYIINEQDEIIGTYKTPQKNTAIIKFLHKDCPFIHSSVIFKKEAYYQTSGYVIGNDICSMMVTDYNLWFELSKIGRCQNIIDKTIYYRVSDKSMSRSINKFLNYSARYMIMTKVHKYYKIYSIYSFFQRLKVQLRIAQFSYLSKTKK